MSHTRPDPTPKPDHIRSLRDLAANFVRAIDRTALEFEGVATTDLTERVTCLVALHDMEGSDLAKVSTEDLRTRLSLIRQTVKAYEGLHYGDRDMTNGELKKRIAYLRQFAELQDADKLDLATLPDDVLAAILEQASDVVKDRKAKAKAEARAKARVAEVQSRHGYQPPTLVPVKDEDDDEVFTEEHDADAA